MKFRSLITMICAGLLASGCQTVANDGPLFCDIEEPRPFPSADVLDFRIETDRDNVIRDVRTNENFETYCE